MPGVLKNGGYGPELNLLNDREKIFAIEYAADPNGARAAREAGYSNPAGAAQKLLARKKVKDAINAMVQPRLKEAKLHTEDIIRQLGNFLWCDILEWVTPEGYLKCNPDELPWSIRQAVIGYKVHHQYDREGNITSTQIEVKLVSKEKALELAMRNLQMLQPDKEVNVNIGFDWASFYGAKGEGNVIDGKAITKRLEGT